MGKSQTETKKAASRFAMLEFIGPQSVNERGAEFRIVVDHCVGPKDAREKAAAKGVEGNVLVVCIHEDLIATPKTEVSYQERATGSDYGATKL
jgi:hypothetical protein